MAAIDLRYDPDYGVLPGETLRETLDALEMTQVQLATRTGLSLKHINQIIQGVAPLTPDTALLLEKATGVAAGSSVRSKSNAAPSCHGRAWDSGL